MWRSLTNVAKLVAKPNRNTKIFNNKSIFRHNSTQAAPKKRSVTKVFGYTLGGLTVATGAGILAGSLYADMSVPLFTKHAVRFLRTAYVGALISWDYKWSLRDIERKDPRYMPIVNEVNLRTAKKLLELCYANRGIYVKAGQHLASLNQVLPKEFTDTLAVLQDKAQYQPLSAVEEVFREDFNRLPNEIFTTFDPVPIAAASLAQVHVATLADGRKCAVKVQYPDIWNMFRGDIKTIEFMVHTIAYLFPDFQFSWIVPEFKEFLTEELDFINEGKNAEKIQSFFPNNKQIQIPKIYWNYSSTTKRVLTMEFCEGVKINDVKGIEDMKLDKAEVAKLLIDLFSEQIFVHGFVHSDPHPGNILVAPLDPNWRTSKKKNLKPKIMLLDHGLYKTLPNELRVDYCELWRALILRDTKNIERYGKKLGAGEYWNLLALVLTFRPVGNTDVGFKKDLTKDDIAKIREMFKGLTPRDGMVIMTKLMEGMPRQLLFVLRTTNLIRSINKDLGASVNRFQVMASYSLKGLEKENKTIGEKLNHWWEVFRFEFNLQFYNVLFWALQKIRSFVVKEKQVDFDQVIEDRMKRVNLSTA